LAEWKGWEIERTNGTTQSSDRRETAARSHRRPRAVPLCKCGVAARSVGGDVGRHVWEPIVTSEIGEGYISKLLPGSCTCALQKRITSDLLLVSFIIITRRVNTIRTRIESCRYLFCSGLGVVCALVGMRSLKFVKWPSGRSVWRCMWYFVTSGWWVAQIGNEGVG